MTNSKDKTREKLVGSLRKTKAIAGIGKDAREGTEAVAQAAPKATKPRSSRATGRVAGTTSSSRPRTVKTVNTDRYQSGRRVWPD